MNFTNNEMHKGTYENARFPKYIIPLFISRMDSICAKPKASFSIISKLDPVMSICEYCSGPNSEIEMNN